jgi:choline dehydrogenase-like flavoprotein
MAAHASVCVIGAGMAGLLLADRLIQYGRSVILVESGLDVFDDAIHQLNEIENVPGRYKWAVSGRYRGLGGTSTKWGGRMIPLSQQEADPRPDLSLPGWPFPISELQKYSSDIERAFKLGPGSFEDEACDYLDNASGLPRGDPDFICRWAKWATYKRGNVALLLTDFARGSKKADLFLGATVCSFSVDPMVGRILEARAKSLGGRELAIKADHFVFAAGTFETTRLLLLLDVASEGRAFERCNVLGRYFQDHLDVQVGQLQPRNRLKSSMLFGPRLIDGKRRTPHFELTSKAKRTDAIQSAFVHVTADLAEHPTLAILKKFVRQSSSNDPSLQWSDFKHIARDAALLSRVGYYYAQSGQFIIPEGVEMKLRVCIEQAPHWDNRISLSSNRDALGVPMIKLNWTTTNVEEQTFRAVSNRVASYWMRSGLNTICPIKWTKAVTDVAIPIVYQAQDYCHPSGTARMGGNPVESVVGPNLRCHHIVNASVASAAVFPTAGSVNPTFTLLQLALRCADSILSLRN